VHRPPPPYSRLHAARYGATHDRVTSPDDAHRTLLAVPISGVVVQLVMLDRGSCYWIGGRCTRTRQHDPEDSGRPQRGKAICSDSVVTPLRADRERQNPRVSNDINFLLVYEKNRQALRSSASSYIYLTHISAGDLPRRGKQPLTPSWC
jgi:hypothetical protein